MTFGEQLKAARKRAGMTQEALAAAVYTTKTAISRYESNQRIPRDEIFARLCLVLQVDIDELQSLARLAGMSGAQVSNGIQSLFPWFDRILEDENHEVHRSNDSAQSKLLASFDELNPKGQQVAVERVEELTKIPDYRKAEDK